MRQYFFNGEKSVINERVRVFSKETKDFSLAILFSVPLHPEVGRFVMLAEDFKQSVIPDELAEGDKIMFLYGNVIVGVAELHVENGTLFYIDKKEKKEICKEVKKNGFIKTERVCDIFYYNEAVCNLLGVQYKKY